MEIKQTETIQKWEARLKHKRARAKGMSEIARKTGLSREQLYRSFSEDGNPTLKSTLAVIKALGIELSAKPGEAA